jgi:hypothetical protein
MKDDPGGRPGETYIIKLSGKEPLRKSGDKSYLDN